MRISKVILREKNLFREEIRNPEMLAPRCYHQLPEEIGTVFDKGVKNSTIDTGEADRKLTNQSKRRLTNQSNRRLTGGDFGVGLDGSVGDDEGEAGGVLGVWQLYFGRHRIDHRFHLV